MPAGRKISKNHPTMWDSLPPISGFVLLLRVILRDIHQDSILFCFSTYVNLNRLVICQRLSPSPGLGLHIGLPWNSAFPNWFLSKVLIWKLTGKTRGRGGGMYLSFKSDKNSLKVGWNPPFPLIYNIQGVFSGCWSHERLVTLHSLKHFTFLPSLESQGPLLDPCLSPAGHGPFWRPDLTCSVSVHVLMCMPSCLIFATLCSPPGSSVHGILQTRILEWVTMPSSRGSSQPRDWTRNS